MSGRMWLALAAALLKVSGGTLWLHADFVEKIKNTAVIDINFRVDQSLKKPHAVKKGGDDGDIHAAGRDNVIRLPLVAEITNAGLPGQAAAMKLIVDSIGKPAIPLSGVWRLWFEHAGAQPQVQGQFVAKPVNTNPDHVFEVHPITAVGGQNIAGSFQWIPGYAPYEAERAFGSYEKLKCTIRRTNKGIEIVTPNAGFNHTEFNIELLGTPAMAGGQALLALADVYDLGNAEDKVNQRPVRMVFLEGSSAANAVQGLSGGDRLAVFGLPRVDLAQVSAIVKKLSVGKTFSGPLPYEMIVVGLKP